MNKKITIAIIILAGIIILATALGYMYWYKKPAVPQQTETAENSQNPVLQEQLPIITSAPAKQGGLVICSDKCGDGICQTEDLQCQGGDLNCICSETRQDCPQDCKE